MLFEPTIDRKALFEPSRREDISVEINQPIAEALGPHLAEFEDYLRKAGASVVSLYPGTMLCFSVSRIYGGPDQHIATVEVGLGALAEMQLRNIAHSAANWLRDFDQDAFVSVSVRETPSKPRTRTYRDRSQYRWWRSDDLNPQAI